MNYRKILEEEAAKNGVRVFYHNKGAQWGRAALGSKRIFVPKPARFPSFFTGLHELGHMMSGHRAGDGKPEYLWEYEAFNWAVKFCMKKGIPVPARTINNERNIIAEKLRERERERESVQAQNGSTQLWSGSSRTVGMMTLMLSLSRSSLLTTGQFYWPATSNAGDGSANFKAYLMLPLDRVARFFPGPPQVKSCNGTVRMPVLGQHLESSLRRQLSQPIDPFRRLAES